MSLIASDQSRIIIGVGETGLSVARYLRSQGLSFSACDTRSEGLAIERFRAEFPDTELQTGPLGSAFLRSASELIISPGVPKDQPAITEAVAAGARLLGDIDLFARVIDAPVIGITGSNGKSTVTSLVGDMARSSGRKVAVGGNIGVPVLDLLGEGQVDLYVLELSSFQLETMNELKCFAATVLNLSADHMDRYANLAAYHQAKHRIFRGCSYAVFNREDALSRPLVPNSVKTCSFGLNQPDLAQYGVIQREGRDWLARGAEVLLCVDEMRLRGQHNHQNALAALALGEAVGLDRDAMLETLREFPGLPHRCQWIRELDGVNWFNDSKGTNLGATLAALKGLGSSLESESKIILIAGGQAKGQSFESLSEPLNRYARALVLIGEDAPRLEHQVEFDAKHREASLAQAIVRAKNLAKPGDLILFSPACASFDMFKNYEARGDAFAELVGGLQ